MSGQQCIQYVRVAAEAGFLETFDRIIEPDHAPTGGEVEEAERSGNSEAPASRCNDAVAVIDEQELSPNPNRKQNRSTFAVVQVP